MKLCFVNPHDMQRMAVYGLAKHLVEKGDYEVTIVQPSRGCKFRRKSHTIRIHDKIEVMSFPAFFLPNIDYNLPFLHKEAELLSRLLSEKKCEIIQACDYDYLTSIAPILVKKRYRAPIILNSDALPGYSWFYGDIVVDSVAKLYTYSLGKWIMNSYDKVVLLYRKAAEEVGKFGVPKEKVLVIPNGVDLQKFKLDFDMDDMKTELSIEPDEKVLLYVGRLEKVKRLEILIALTKSLVNEGYKVKTIIVGNGTCKEYYKKQAAPISRNVIFTGHVPRGQVYKYYLMSDVFVFPSLSEGLPTVLLEAAAAGKPSVATSVNGVLDIVVHGETGYLVEGSDLESYLSHVKTLITDENLAKKMGKKAAANIRQTFNWETVVARYERLYRGLIDS